MKTNDNFKLVGKNAKIYPLSKIINATNLELGDDVTIMDFVFLNAGKCTIIGNRSQINAQTIFAGSGEVIIGKDVCISYGVKILSGTDSSEGSYMVDARSLNQRHVIRGRIIIKDKVFIGANTVICVSKNFPEIVIEEGVVVRAQSYIDKNLTQKYFIYDGNKPITLRSIKKE